MFSLLNAHARTPLPQPVIGRNFISWSSKPTFQAISSEAFASIAHHCGTLFFFTKSDFKTTVFPITTFAIAAGPLLSKKTLIECMFWVWLHLLQFNVANQYLDPEEDVRNKPDRPLPAGRITLDQARWLRWALTPICIGYSALYSRAVAAASTALALLVINYNELGVHTGHWLHRSCLNALGLGCYEVGASLIAGNRLALDETGVLSVLISVGIIATTYQTADFKDCEGDRAVGRKTLPITRPHFARLSVFVALVIWSIVVSCAWQLGPAMAIPFCSLGLFIGMRFLTLKGKYEDQISFYWYNLWLTAVHIIPGIWRSMYSNETHIFA